MSSFIDTQNNMSTDKVDDLSIKCGDKVKITAAPPEMEILGKTGFVTEIHENFRDSFRNYIISSEDDSLNGEFSLAWDVKVEKTEATQTIEAEDKIESEKVQIDVLGIGLDTSGSMAGILSTVVDEGKGAIDALNPDQVVFCEFSSTFECYTTDIEKSKIRMDQVTASGGTAMYDGVTTMMRELIKLSLQGKKVIALVITDGMENSSVKYTNKDLEIAKERLRELSGSDCIREICIGSNLTEANNLMNHTPGLSRETSAPATRNLKSISCAIRSMSNLPPPMNPILPKIQNEDKFMATPLPNLKRL